MGTEALNELAKRLYRAKRAELEAKADRIAVEELIANQVKIDGDKGSKTVDAGDGMKVTVKCGVNYKADVDAIRNLDLPEGVMPVKHVPASWAFDEKAYQSLLVNHPDLALKLADCVTSTPAKVSVSLKLA